jgi:hypothetical protein
MCIANSLRVIALLAAICIFATPADCQIITSKEVVVKKNGQQILPYLPAEFGGNDKLQVEVSFNVFNNTGNDIYLVFELFMFSNNEAAGTGCRIGPGKLEPGRSTLIASGPSIGLPPNPTNERIEFRWLLTSAPDAESGNGDNAEGVVTDLADGQGHCIWHKAPLAIETIVAYTPEPVDDAGNWMGVGRAEVLDSLYQMQRDKQIDPDSPLGKIMNQAGQDFGKAFRALCRQTSDGEIDEEECSVAMAVARKRQFDEISAQTNSELMGLAIKLSIQKRLRIYALNAGKTGDVALLRHPQVIKLLELDQQQLEKIDTHAKRLLSTTKAKKQFIDAMLRASQKASRETKTTTEFAELISVDYEKTFNAMIRELSPKQKEIYKANVGEKCPVEFDNTESEK